MNLEGNSFRKFNLMENGIPWSTAPRNIQSVSPSLFQHWCYMTIHLPIKLVILDHT